MAQLTDQQVEALVDAFMIIVDEETGTEVMTTQEAIDSWNDIDAAVHDALDDRVNAAEEDDDA